MPAKRTIRPTIHNTIGNGIPTVSPVVEGIGDGILADWMVTDSGELYDTVTRTYATITNNSVDTKLATTRRGIGYQAAIPSTAHRVVIPTTNWSPDNGTVVVVGTAAWQSLVAESFLAWQASGTMNNSFQLHKRGTNPTLVTARLQNSGGTVVRSEIHPTAPSNEPLLIGMRWTPTTIQGYSSDVGFANSTNRTGTFTTTPTHAYLGIQPTGLERITQALHRVVVFNRALSDAEFAALAAIVSGPKMEGSPPHNIMRGSGKHSHEEIDNRLDNIVANVADEAITIRKTSDKKPMITLSRKGSGYASIKNVAPDESNFTILQIEAPDTTGNEATLFLGRSNGVGNSEGIDLYSGGIVGGPTGNSGIVLQRRGTGVKRDFFISHKHDVTESEKYLMLKADTANCGIHCADPQTKLDVNGNSIRIRDSKTPTSATSAGHKGEICWDNDYIYVCVETNTWKRIATASW